MPNKNTKNLLSKTVQIKGMHCRSCEILIEESLLAIDNVKSVKVSEKLGIAEVYYENSLDDNKVTSAITDNGYSLGKSETRWFSHDPHVYDNLIKSAIAIFFLFTLAKLSGILNLANFSPSNLDSIPVVFLVGLTAGVSTCMALVGGLVLGVSARYSEKNPNASASQKFKPHIFFNLGRIVFFGLFGAIIGYFGSIVQMGPTSIGFLTIFMGIVMLLLGLQTINVFPILEKVKLTLPKSLYKLVGIDTKKQNEYTNKNAFILGGLTFFLPCGFTQAMQLYAISSGSPLLGAVTMATFAAGTTPGLVGIGGLTSVVKGGFAKLFYSFVGLIVILFAVFNINNGVNLLGINIPRAKSPVGSETNLINEENGVQVVRMTQDYNGYSPNNFTIKKGVPVKWIINSVDANTCANSIYSAKLGIKKSLKPGENIIEFTAKETGTIKFTCSMGMFTGYFTVVEGEVGSNNTQPNCDTSLNTKGCELDLKADTNDIPANTNIASEDSQKLVATYSLNTDIQPNNFVVKKGQPVSLEILAKDNGLGCMGSIALPGLSSDYEVFRKNEKVVFNFTPQKAGDYQITCAMGVPRGTITVQ